VIREFALHEVPVRALVRSLTKAYSLASLPNVEFVVGDMWRPDTLDRALGGIPPDVADAFDEQPAERRRCPESRVSRHGV